MMKLELKMEKPAKNQAIKSASTIAAFLFNRRIHTPVFRIFVFSSSKSGFLVSCIVTILALIVFGFFSRGKMTGQPLLKDLKVAILVIVAANCSIFWLAKWSVRP